MDNDQELSKEEVDRRAAETLRRLIATPPQPKWRPPKKAKPDHADASKPGRRGHAGEAS